MVPTGDDALWPGGGERDGGGDAAGGRVNVVLVGKGELAAAVGAKGVEHGVLGIGGVELIGWGALCSPG